MTRIGTPIARLASAAFLTLSAFPAIAQQLPQNLTITFDVIVPAAPLSDWLTAGIALLLAATAMVAMRQRKSRGARFFSAVVALAAGATIFSIAGNRLTQDANAIVPAPVINLVSSPASLNVTPYIPTSPLAVTVNNQTGMVARITGITLGNGFYTMSTPTTCSVGLNMGPGNSCIITLVFND